MHVTKIEIVTFDLAKEDESYSYYERLRLHNDNGYNVEIQSWKGTEVRVCFKKEIEQ